MTIPDSAIPNLSPELRGLLEEVARRGLTLPPDLVPSPAPPLSFREFVDQVRPGYRWYKHCEILAAVLQRVADGELRRVLVFMPPRHGKSELVSRLFTAYWLYRRPHQWVSICSYGAELAYTLSRSSRENFQRGGGRVKDDAAAVKHWETTAGGGLWAAGVGGPATGKGWHLGVIDDPIKNAEEAASEAIATRNREWYESVFYTREEPGDDGDPDGALVVINTRWHEKDLTGWLLEQEGSEDDEPERWHVVSLEAIKEPEPPEIPATCTLEPDWREPGEALCPERRPLAKLRRIARRIGGYFWSALFQQRPRPRDGGFFKWAWFEKAFVDAAPVNLVRVRYWDTAGTEGGGDWTVGVLMGRCEAGLYWILDVTRGQWSPGRRATEMRAAAERDGPAVRQWLERESGVGGADRTRDLTRTLAGFPVSVEPATGSKEFRAEPFAAQCEAGNVRVVRAPWNKTLLDELLGFPTGAHDDQVDAASGAFNKLANRKRFEEF